MDRLEELVYLTIGRASMCWSEFPKGVFDDERASQLGKDLIAAIKAHEQTAIEEAHTTWYLTTPHVIRDANGHEVARMRSLEIGGM